jgi:uncharacterized sulfatase
LIELCDLTNSRGAQFDGQSIAPLLRGEDTRWPQRTLFIDHQEDQLIKAGQGRFGSYAILTEDWRLVNGELYDIAADPGQQRDLAHQNPELVQSLLAAYGRWYEDVTSHGGAYTRFYVGASLENPTTFTVRDWHPTEGQVIWRQAQLADDTLFINGFWALDVKRKGRYQVQLSRYPNDAYKPMGADLAKISLGTETHTKKIRPEDETVTFELDLDKGPVRLQSWLRDKITKRERGSYFVSCTLLSAD